MRVCLNALGVPSFYQGGAGFYTATLLDGLGCADGLEVEALVNHRVGEECEVLAPAARCTVVGPSARSAPRKAANYLRAARAPTRLDLGFERPAARADLVHWPISFMHAPAPEGARRVLTVLDIQHEVFPEFFSRSDRVLRRLRWRPSARAADRVIAISAFTRRELCERYDVPEDRVTAIPLCCRADFRSDAPAPGPPPPLDDGGQWFVYPASPLGAKNHGRLFDALALHRARVDPDARLVLCGPALHSWDEVRRMIAERRLEPAVILLGHVDDEVLRGLYQRATGLVFPSLYEGFGLPVLEALGQGCPVAASTAGSLPEVAGDAALLFDPEDAEAIAAAMARIASFSDAEREAISAAGRARARLFSPEEMVDRTVAVYREVLA